jgi:hypothetical protein
VKKNSFTARLISSFVIGGGGGSLKRPAKSVGERTGEAGMEALREGGV